MYYLYIGALWIGALVDTGGYEFPRVSVGHEGWTGPGNNNFELEPGESGGLPIEEHGILEQSCIPGAVDSSGAEIYSPDAIAPQEFIAVYTDTLTEYFWTGTDIIDGPHFPLGLRVMQKAMVWDAWGFDDFVIYEFTIENIGAYDLKNLYLGLYVDGDVGWLEESQYHWDDVTGFLEDYAGETWNVPYIADNDGRPSAVSSGNDFTCPGVSGIYALLPPTEAVYTSCNWWFPNANPALDFGPHWEDDGALGSWPDTLGTPNGDARKYFVMTNKEIDYDQWYVADQAYQQSHPQVFIDPFTGETTVHNWRWEEHSEAEDLANGYDARYMISWGPLGQNVALAGEVPETYLYPGDSLQLTVAYVCGDGFHDPDNPQGNCTGVNPLDPSKYIYDDFVYNCSKARFLVENNYAILPPYTPQNLHVTATPDTAIWLSWDEYSNTPDTRIDLYRRPDGGKYGTDPINGQPIEGTSFADMTDFTLGELYYYKAQAVRYDSLRSYFCAEIPIRAGAPVTPTGLSATSSLNGLVLLSWEANPDPDLNHYNIYREDTTGVLEMIGTAIGIFEHFPDTTVDNGICYTYSITAVDHGGFESFFSDTTTATPMGLYKPLLIIRERASYTLDEWPDSLLDSFYDQLFLDIGEATDFLTPSVESSDFPSLQELSDYQVIWIINDLHANSSLEYRNTRDNVLMDYLSLGGRVILSGRRLFAGSFGCQQGWSATSSYSFEPLLKDYFKIDLTYATYFSGYTLEFKSASSNIPDYPDLEPDLTKCVFWPSPSLWWYQLEVDGMIPNDEGEILYTFESECPDTSTLHGRAVGILSTSPTEPTAIFTFPLYAMEPYDSVKALASRILDDVRSISVGEPPPPEPPLPADYALKQNYPNPFNAQTVIEFEVPYVSSVNLSIYDIQGRLVATLLDRPYPQGNHRISFNGEDLSSGIYFARLTAGSYYATKKMVLLK